MRLCRAEQILAVLPYFIAKKSKSLFQKRLLIWIVGLQSMNEAFDKFYCAWIYSSLAEPLKVSGCDD